MFLKNACDLIGPAAQSGMPSLSLGLRINNCQEKRVKSAAYREIDDKYLQQMIYKRQSEDTILFKMFTESKELSLRLKLLSRL